MYCLIIPIGFWAKNKNHTDHSAFICEKLNYFIDFFERESLLVRFSSSDGWNDNLTKVVNYFNSFCTDCGLSLATKQHIRDSIADLKMFCKEFPDINVKPSALSTLIVENFFSIIRGKCRYPSIMEYDHVMDKAYFVLQYQNSEEA